MQVNYDERKLTELVSYIAERLLSDTSGGTTKLNKLLYFADFAHVRRTDVWPTRPSSPRWS